MFALVQNGRVYDISNTEFPVHSAFRWIPCDDTTTLGHTYDGAIFNVPFIRASYPPTADEIYDQAIKNSKVLKALVLSINDGTLVPGAGVNGATLKSIIKANM